MSMPLQPRRRPPACRWPLACALLLPLWLGACQAQAPAPAPAPAPAAAPAANREAALLQRIEAEIGSAACTSNAECRTLAVGAKACGGPARWLAWSATASQGDRLQAWAGEHARLQRQREAAEGMVSNCSVVPDPGAACIAGRCVTAGANLAR